jgi:hypothetical protein
MAARGRGRGSPRGRCGWSGHRDDRVVRWDADREHGPDDVRRPEPVTGPGQHGGTDGNCHPDADRDRHHERARCDERAEDDAADHVADHGAAHVVIHAHRHRYPHRFEHPDHGAIRHLRNWLLIGLRADPDPGDYRPVKPSPGQVADACHAARAAGHAVTTSWLSHGSPARNGLMSGIL